MSTGTTYSINVALAMYTGTKVWVPRLRYDRNAEKLQYYNDAGGYTDIATVTHYAKDYNFSTIKLVVDFERGEYVRATVFGNEFDLSGIPVWTTGNATDARVLFMTEIVGLTAVPSTVYVENMILTENEPL